jgi:hypothetical protein
LSIAASRTVPGRLPGKSKDRFLQVVNSGVIRSSYEPEGVNRSKV